MICILVFTKPVLINKLYTHTHIYIYVYEKTGNKTHRMKMFKYDKINKILYVFKINFWMQIASHKFETECYQFK